MTTKPNSRTEGKERPLLVRQVEALLAYRASLTKAKRFREEVGTVLPIEAVRACDLPTRTEIEAKREPVERELRAAIRASGEQLFALGGFPAMKAACDVVEDELGCRGIAVVDRAWDRIGNVWWA